MLNKGRYLLTTGLRISILTQERAESRQDWQGPAHRPWGHLDFPGRYNSGTVWRSVCATTNYLLPASPQGSVTTGSYWLIHLPLAKREQQGIRCHGTVLSPKKDFRIRSLQVERVVCFFRKLIKHLSVQMVFSLKQAPRVRDSGSFVDLPNRSKRDKVHYSET